MSAAERAAAAQERIAAGLEAVVAEQARQRRERDEETRRRAERVGHVSEPRTFNVLDACRVAHGLAGAFRTIPPEFWSIDRNVVTVACPCGAEPELHPGALGVHGVPVGCSGDDCERFYAYDGCVVRVAFSPVKAAEKS